MYYKKIIILITSAIIIGLGVSGYFIFDRKKNNFEITNFEECAKVGNPVTMSYPRTCKTADGKVFNEKLLGGIEVNQKSDKDENLDDSKKNEDSEETKIGGGEKQEEGDKVIEKTFSNLRLLKKIEISNGARPEIIAAKDRVFVVYLEPLMMTGNLFKVKIFDKDMAKELSSKTLVSKTGDYGNPTDIRIVADESYLYAFYETAGNNKSYLFGAKYSLDDKFERVAFQGPISQSTMFLVAKSGDEKLDDPAPMIVGEDVYVMTRYKSTLAKEGATQYKLYKFDKNLIKKSEQAIDLSDYADGEARQSSIIFDNGYYYIAMQTTTGTGNIIETVEWSAPSDILVVKLDKNFKAVETKIIASESGYTEAYVTGLKTDDQYFYITYNQVVLGKEFSSIIKIFDKSWNVVLTEKYKTAAVGKALRPSIDVVADKIYAGNDEQGTNKADIYIFEKQK